MTYEEIYEMCFIDRVWPSHFGKRVLNAFRPHRARPHPAAFPELRELGLIDGDGVTELGQQLYDHVRTTLVLSRMDWVK